MEFGASDHAGWNGSELNSMYWSGLVFGIGINISVNSLLFIIKRPLDADL